MSELKETEKIRVVQLHKLTPIAPGDKDKILEFLNEHLDSCAQC